MASHRKLRYHRQERGRCAARVRDRGRSAMTLPLMAASAGGRSGRRIAGAAFLFLLLLVQAAGEPARAQETDPFSADGEGRRARRYGGQGARGGAGRRPEAGAGGDRRAPARAAGRRPKLPKLDDKAITDLVSSFEVANERMSAVRYLADYTFHFRPAETRRVLGVAATGAGTRRGAAQAGRSAKPDVAEPSAKPHRDHPGLPVGGASGIVGGSQPVARGLGSRTGNTGAALSSRSAMPAISPRSTPARRVPEIATRSRRSPAAMAARRRSSRLRSCRVHPIEPTGLDVAAAPLPRRPPRRHAQQGVQRQPRRKHGRTAAPGRRRSRARYRRRPGAGAAAVGCSEQEQAQALTAVLPIDGLDDWLRVRERLQAVPAIRSVTLTALSRQEATIAIDYTGTIEQLKSELAKISLEPRAA